MYYKICENCGAWLDVGERCDCTKEDQHPAPAPEENKSHYKTIAIYEEGLNNAKIMFDKQ